MSGFFHRTTLHSLRTKREKHDFCYFHHYITQTVWFPKQGTLCLDEWNVFCFSFHLQGVYNGVQGVYLTVTHKKSLKISVDFIWSYPNSIDDFLISMNQVETPCVPLPGNTKGNFICHQFAHWQLLMVYWQLLCTVAWFPCPYKGRFSFNLSRQLDR